MFYLFLREPHKLEKMAVFPQTCWRKGTTKTVRPVHFYFLGRCCHVLSDSRAVRSVWWSNSQACTIHISYGMERRGGKDVLIRTWKFSQSRALAIIYFRPYCPRNICIGKLSKFFFQVSLEKKMLPELRKTFWTHSIYHVYGCLCVCLHGRWGRKRGKYFQVADSFSSGWKRCLKSMEPGWVTTAEDLAQAAAMLYKAVVWKNLNVAVQKGKLKEMFGS